MGLFGNLFDFNNDGKLDGFEEAVEFAAFATLMDAEEARKKSEALEDAGLDPDDYDFD